jgi:hypothetical protein
VTDLLQLLDEEEILSSQVRVTIAADHDTRPLGTHVRKKVFTGAWISELLDADIDDRARTDVGLTVVSPVPG